MCSTVFVCGIGKFSVRDKITRRKTIGTYFVNDFSRNVDRNVGCGNQFGVSDGVGHEIGDSCSLCSSDARSIDVGLSLRRRESLLNSLGLNKWRNPISTDDFGRVK